MTSCMRYCEQATAYSLASIAMLVLSGVLVVIALMGFFVYVLDRFSLDCEDGCVVFRRPIPDGTRTALVELEENTKKKAALNDTKEEDKVYDDAEI